MSTVGPTHWYHSNRYSADRACEHCHGVLRHESWCITRNSNLLYAYEIIQDSDKLTEQDRLILHALGASWTGTSCRYPKPVVDRQE